MSFIDKDAVKDAVSFPDTIELLGLRMKLAGNQFRSECPCGRGDDRSLTITPDKGFYCQGAKQGGDQIALVMHVMDVPFKEALQFLAEHARLGTTSTGTSGNRSRERQEPESERGQRNPRQPRGGADKASPHPFDPDEFWAKTTYTEEVEALGISEDQAEELRIGFYRGKLYQALRYADGKVAGYSSFANGELKLPSNLLPSNVVPFQKRA